MRPIDADALKENCYKKMDELMGSTSEHLPAEALSILCGFTLIDSAPTIDAVSVVRCKECKHWRNTDAEKIPTASIACGNMHPDDFCSYGERKGE